MLPNIFWKFPKITEDFQRLAKITEDYGSLPKTFEEHLRMFRWYTNEFQNNLRDKLDISEIINIFTSEDMENMPLKSRMSFCMNFTSDVFSIKTRVYIRKDGYKETVIVP